MRSLADHAWEHTVANRQLCPAHRRRQLPKKSLELNPGGANLPEFRSCQRDEAQQEPRSRALGHDRRPSSDKLRPPADEVKLKQRDRNWRRLLLQRNSPQQPPLLLAEPEGRQVHQRPNVPRRTSQSSQGRGGTMGRPGRWDDRSAGHTKALVLKRSNLRSAGPWISTPPKAKLGEAGK